VTDLIHLAIPAFIGLLVLEAVVDAIMRRELYLLPDTAASLTMGTGSVLLGLITKGLAFGAYTAAHRFALFNIGYQWWAWVLIVFADDLTYYVYHRTSHECRLFWASHVIHHSSQRYNLGAALRQTWTGGFMSFIFWLWLPLAGFQPAMVLSMQAISLLYQFWIHTELVRSMGPLEAVLNTPSHHRVHHAANGRYLDRNHAGIFIIWDRLFGAFEPEDMADKPVYGLTKNINSYNPLRIAFHEWIDIGRDLRTAPTLREKFACVFGRPGRKYERAEQPAEQQPPISQLKSVS
jgi:sterol desaturase/sphingolipid hydroxylase (fatty acid hydroxylase superfamily)